MFSSPLQNKIIIIINPKSAILWLKAHPCSWALRMSCFLPFFLVHIYKREKII
jgi:hypothetical protein